jgi:hypothetical protein
LSDPCKPYNGHHSEGRTSCLWVVDPRELEKVKLQGGSTRLPVTESRSLDPLIGIGHVCSEILSTSFDPVTNRIYLAIPDFTLPANGRPPAIVVLEVKNL